MLNTIADGQQFDINKGHATILYTKLSINLNALNTFFLLKNKVSKLTFNSTVIWFYHSNYKINY